MKNFVKHFRREDAGIWVCVEAATLDLPQGRIQIAVGSRFTRGTTFMNVALAGMLDEEYERQNTGPPDPTSTGVVQT